MLLNLLLLPVIIAFLPEKALVYIIRRSEARGRKPEWKTFILAGNNDNILRSREKLHFKIEDIDNNRIHPKIYYKSFLPNCLSVIKLQ